MPLVKVQHHTETERRWTRSYVGLAWLAELGNGVIQTITGPMQPYLAYNLATDTSTINLVWTLGFSGFLIGSILTSHIFTKYLTSSRMKLSFMSSILLLTGLSTLLMPFMPNLPLLLACRFLQFAGYGIFLTADSVLLVFALGPKRSRPFINALHFFISIGFLMGTFLVQPFLPGGTRAAICAGRESESTGNTTNVIQPEMDVIPMVHGIQSIAWPFVISGCWCVLVSIGFFILSRASTLVSMPQFYDENTNTKGKDYGPAKLSYFKKRVFLLLIVIFFALSGAVIRVFQSMAMTFGMCGPLQLESHMAAITDSFYSTGMCVGRFASILLATKLLPSTLLVLCMVGCTIAAFLLIILAPIYHLSLYTGVAFMGFFASWQFGTGFSWTSHHMNITGRLSSIFFIGLGVGSLASPPLAGWLFLLQPLNVLWLVFVMVLLQVLTVAVMWVVTRGLSLPCL